MNTDTLITFFNSKLDKLPELRKLATDEDQAFTEWWNTITATYERMGDSYKNKADSINFSSSVVIRGEDNSASYAQAYQSGLNDAEAFIKSTIEELETWGFNGEPAHATSKKSTESDNRISLHLTITQQQVQQITQSINLAQYDEATQGKVEELLNELKKENKDKPKIISIVRWLADKGSDALIAILLAATNLT